MPRTNTSTCSPRASRRGGIADAEVLSIEEIERRFKDEWILVADPIENENLDVLGGRVVIHSKDRDEVYRKAVELKLRHGATLYTGKPPEDILVNL